MTTTIKYLLFATLILSGTAFANDAAFYGAGATVYPITDTRIRMVTEDLTIAQAGPAVGSYVDQWAVTVLYTFENETDKRITVQMGFPERCHWEPGDDEDAKTCKKPSIQEFQALVDGKPARVRVKTRQKANRAELKDLNYQRVHTFSVTFEPRQKRTIRHTYRHFSSLISPYTSELEYILRTGGLWSNTIQRLNITVKVWDHFEKVRFDPQSLSGATKSVEDGWTHYRWTLKDYEPTQNLVMLFERPHGLDREVAIEAACVHDKRELQAMDKSTRKRLRNTIYAAYGYTFKNAELSALFRKQAWYRPRSDYRETWIKAHHRKCISAILAADQ